MALSEREELEQLRAEAGPLTEREQLEVLRAEAGPLTAEDTAQRDTMVQSFNRGIVDFLNAPANLVNLGVSLFNRAGELGPHLSDIGIGSPDDEFKIPHFPGTQELEQVVEDTGMLGDERGEGWAARTMEIAGASALPAMGLLARGNQIVNATGQVVKNPKSILAEAARNPKTTITADVVSSGTAALGGEVGKNFTDEPAYLAMWEIIGGLTPVAAVKLSTSGPTAKIAGKTGDLIAQTVIPFTQRGAAPRAARRLQGLSNDPEGAAAAIKGGEEGLSPARKASDKRLLALEEEILAENPDLEVLYSERLQVALETARKNVTTLGGEKGKPRVRMRAEKEHLISLLNIRASIAAEKAAIEIKKLGPNATPREISVVARKHLEAALKAERAMESGLWEGIDQTALVDFPKARAVFAKELANRTRMDDSSDIPAWLKGLMKEPTKEIAEATTLKEVQALRKRVQKEIRREKGKPDTNWDTVRILGDVDKALLKDLENIPSLATSKEYVAARAFSRQLNQKFTEGEVGNLLGSKSTGGSRVAPEDTLQQLLTGSTATTDLAQMLKASPAARITIEDFIKARYLSQVVPEQGFNQKAHNAFINKYKDSGIFELLPGLEAQLRNSGNLSQAAERLGIKATAAAEALDNPNVSHVALYLNNPGKEMRALFSADNPVKTARSWRTVMRGDAKALRGLKELFAEEIFNMSKVGAVDDAGEQLISGNKMQRIFDENIKTGRALGMDETDISKFRHTINVFRKAELRAAKLAKGDRTIIPDTPAAILDFIAALIGAKSGQKAAGAGMGSSMVLAGRGSTAFRERLAGLTSDKAEKLLVAAHQPTKEGEALFRALLTRSSDPKAKQAKAIKRINTWLAGTGVDQLDKAVTAEYDTPDGLPRGMQQ